MSKILESLQKINDELAVIKKDQSGYGYNFRGIDQVLNTMSPLFKKYKIIVSREIKSEVRSHRIERDSKGNERQVNQVSVVFKYRFTSTEDGSEFVTEGIGEGEDRGDKATGCAISNSYKYAIFEMFNIATEEQQDSDMKYAKENNSKLPKKKKEVEDSDGFGEDSDKEEPKKEEKKPKRRFKRPDKKEDEGFGG